MQSPKHIYPCLGSLWLFVDNFGFGFFFGDYVLTFVFGFRMVYLVGGRNEGEGDEYLGWQS